MSNSFRSMDVSHGGLVGQLHDRRPWITPTWITLGGIVPLALFCVSFIYAPYLSLALVVLLGILDILDGALARVRNLASDAGAFCDQAFDKVRAYAQYSLVLYIGFEAGYGSGLISSSWNTYNWVVWIFVAVMFLCDLSNMMIRIRNTWLDWTSWEKWCFIKQVDTSESSSSSTNAGKVKVWLQQISVGAMTLGHALHIVNATPDHDGVWKVSQIFILWLTIGLTVLWLIYSFSRSRNAFWVSTRWIPAIFIPTVLLSISLYLGWMGDEFWIIGHVLIVPATILAGVSTYGQINRVLKI